MVQQRRWISCLALVLLQPAGAQEPAGSAHAEEAAIRTIVEQYQRAARNSDAAGVKAVMLPGAKGVSPGGTVASDLALLRSATLKTRSNLLRRIMVLGPTVAVASGVWRSFESPPPFDTGTFQYTLLRGEGGWKIAYSHGAFLPGPAEHRIAATDPDPPAGGGQDGWITLFDGKNLDAWVSAAVGTDMREAWRIEDGALVAVPGLARSGLLTRQLFRFFELQFEWLAAPGSNSGVKYRIIAFDRLGGRSAEPLGAEYQIADDDGDEGARVDPLQRSGALYSAIPVERSVALPLGQWNQSRILVTLDSIEHWLNGTKTAAYKPDIPFASAIALQHHMTQVRFRNIRIRPR